ncbi:MAG: GNAT family N-acetyltransferase [Lachnospiraceae bacterium]|nr:GNAT family N-acetyltransferase [Lachnospiraceae bacterium]
MIFKRNIDIEIRNDSSSLYVYALYKNYRVGKIACGIDEETKLITIGDITCKKNNKGYGSLMMAKLIEFAKVNDFQGINGWLSHVDMEHEERLYHFYQKFGFEIVPNDDGLKVADIKLQL